MKQSAAELGKLVDPSKTQVFLLACPAHVPLNYFAHPWFVVNKKGSLERWEVRFEKNTSAPLHIHRDALPPFEGIEIFSFSKKYRWPAELIGVVEGATAEKIAGFLGRSAECYPYRDRYSLFGPNSDTYAQWVLNAFPEWKISLPKNTVGKNYGINAAPKIKTGVVHGRFQPPHNGHIRYMLGALSRAEFLYIGICTPKICTAEEAARTGYPCTAELNPFTHEERAAMIALALGEAGIPKERYAIIPFPSDYKDINALLPKDAVFLMSVTGESDRAKVAYIERLGFRAEIVMAKENDAPRERSGAVRTSAQSGQADWENMVPESIARYIKEHGLVERL